MNQPKHAVRVTIGGEDYTVRSELPPNSSMVSLILRQNRFISYK